MAQCLNYGKVMHLMRCVPPRAIATALGRFDDLVVEHLSLITGIAADARTRELAQLLLSLRSAALHAPAAYVASRTQTRSLCARVDSAFAWDPTVPGSGLAEAVELLHRSLPPEARPDPELPSAIPQKVLSAALDQALATKLLATAPSEAQQANLLSELQPGAGDFLQAQPIKMDGVDLTFTPAEFVVALRYRLGLPQAEAAGFCGLCGKVFDVYGYHATKCRKQGLGGRHDALRDQVFEWTKDARWRSEREKPGLLPPSPDDPAGRRRPADVYDAVLGAIDFAVTSPIRHQVQYDAARTPLAAALQYEEFKRTYLDTAAQCSRQGFEYTPAIFETTGARTPTVSRMLHDLARARAARRGAEPARIVRQQHEALSVIIRRQNARYLLRHLHVDSPGDLVWRRARAQTVLAAEPHPVDLNTQFGDPRRPSSPLPAPVLSATGMSSVFTPPPPPIDPCGARCSASGFLATPGTPVPHGAGAPPLWPRGPLLGAVGDAAQCAVATGADAPSAAAAAGQGWAAAQGWVSPMTA
eukprot:gene19408-biopygen21572